MGKAEGIYGLRTDLVPAELKPIPVKTKRLFISARIRDNVVVANSNSSNILRINVISISFSLPTGQFNCIIFKRVRSENIGPLRIFVITFL